MTDAAGKPAPDGSQVILRLSQEGTVTDPALLLQQPPVTCTITSGAIAAACTVRSNDDISPAGTFYMVRIVTSTGQQLLPERNYTITGTTWDIGTSTPLASATVAATAYQIVQDEGTNVAQRRTINFTGTGVSVADNSGTGVTDITISSGAGATHQIDGVALTAQDPINLLDTAEFDWTNPAAGDLSLALKAGFVNALADLAGDLCGTNEILEDQGASWACIATPSGGAGAQHQVDGVNVADNSTINFQDTTAVLFSNPSFGNIQATIASGGVTDPMLASNYSGVGSCAASQFANALNDNAAPGCAQPAFSDLSGSATKAQLPAAVAYEDEANIFTAAGGLTLDNQLELRLREATVNGTNFFGMRSSAARAADYTVTWAVTGDCTANVNAGALTINASNEIVCSDDDGGAGGSGDTIEVEDGDDLGTFTPIDTTARFEDQGDINFQFTDGGAGGPDTVIGVVRPSSVTLAKVAFDPIEEAELDTLAELNTHITDANLVPETRTLTGGAGIAALGDLSANRTVATASQEAGFLANGGAVSLTCGAGNAGKMQVMDNGDLEFCDGAATPALQKALTESDQSAGTNLGADLEEEAHASEHQHGGADEVATATPAANAIPKAGAGGDLDAGWLPAHDVACATNPCVQTTEVVDALKTKSITFIKGADGGSALADSDDQATFWRNNIAAMTITEVWCESDAGTPSINLRRDDGTPANILSSNLSCSTSGATGTIDLAEDNVAVGDKLDFEMVTAGGTAARVTVSIKATLD